MSIDVLLQQIVNGLVLGSVYALVALGYTMVYGILQWINFAHGEIVMIGGLTALFASKGLLSLGVPPDRAEIIAFDGNFHGRTTTIVSFSTDEQYRDGFGPFTPGFKVVPYGDADAAARAGSGSFSTRAGWKSTYCSRTMESRPVKRFLR